MDLNKVPSFDELINPLFLALKSLGGSGSTNELYEKVIEMYQFSDDVLSIMQNENSTQTKVAYRLAWARTYLKKFGVINNTSRGIWVINSNFEKCDGFDSKEVVKKVRELSSASKEILDDNNLENDEIELPSEIESWRQDLKEVLYKMNPFEFEKLTQLMLRESGFSQVEVTKRSGDGGIDGFGKFKINGMISFKIAFQCKRYKGLVSTSEIRDFRGSMTTDIEKGIFVTTGDFTRSAKEEATADGKKHIDLIDGEELVNKLAELKLGIKVEKKYIVDKDFFLGFSDK